MVRLSKEFTGRGHRVLAPDLPFHGKSRDCRPSNLHEAAMCILKALTNFLGTASGKPLPIAIAGYSLGGRIALEIAEELSRQQAPAFDVQALVLISSAPPPETEAECKARAESGQAIGARLKRVSPTNGALQSWLLCFWYTSPMWNQIQDSRGYVDMIKSRVEDFDDLLRDAWAEGATNMAKYTWPKSYQVNAPVLYVHGKVDKKYTAFCPRMSSLFTNLSIAAIEEAGHNVLVQQPGKSVDVVHRFIQGEYRFAHCYETVQIDSVKVLRYSLPLKKPMMVNGQLVSHREGFLLTVSSSAIGISGVGDICPLPGLHAESVDKCQSEVEDVMKFLQKPSRALWEKCCIMKQIEELTDGASCVTRNGITSAVLHLFSQAEKIELNVLLTHLLALQSVATACHQNESKIININGVLPRTLVKAKETGATSHSELKENIMHFTEQSPFKVLKVKVGTMGNAEEEGEIIGVAGQEALNLKRMLRLDANKTWTKQQFDDFQCGIGDMASSIEFIEEPFRSGDELKKFLRDPRVQSSLHIGLDESLSEYSLIEVWEMASSRRCQALIVKPAVIGLLSHTFDLSSIAARTNCKIVMSSVFDSGVGLAWTTLLAAVCQTQHTFHGLGTFEYLHEDVLDPGFKSFCVDESMCVSIQKCQEFLARAAQLVVFEGTELFV